MDKEITHKTEIVLASSGVYSKGNRCIIPLLQSDIHFIKRNGMENKYYIILKRRI